jgi:hypothetical protein
MIGDAQLAPDHGGHPLSGPHVAQKTIGFGAVREQRRQLGPLLGRQFGRGARRHPMVQGPGAAGPGPLEPLIHGTIRHAERLANRPAGPARSVGVVPGRGYARAGPTTSAWAAHSVAAQISGGRRKSVSSMDLGIRSHCPSCNPQLPGSLNAYCKPGSSGRRPLALPWNGGAGARLTSQCRDQTRRRRWGTPPVGRSIPRSVRQ